MNVQTGGMTYARFFPSDWRSGCLALTLEEEGLYIRCCAYMYDTGKQIPADEATAARLLNVNRLQYRKVMAALILKDKLIRAQGYIFNERVTAEIDRFRSEFAKRSAASKAREEARKKQLQVEIEKALKEKAAAEATPPDTPRVTPPDTPPVTRGVTPNALGGLLGGLGAKTSNEIKEGGTRAQAETDLSSAPNPESRIQNPEKKEEEEVELGANAPPSHAEALEAFELYNQTATKVGIPAARTLTPQRKKAIMARMREHGGLDAWKIALGNIERSAFLQGKNDRNWVATLDFLIQASSFTKVVEGTYGNGAHAEKATTKTSQVDRMRGYFEDMVAEVKP